MANLVDKVAEAAEKAAEAAEKKAEELRQQLKELRRETQQQLDRMADQIRGYGSDVTRDTQSHIRDRPLTSVGGAFALGMVVGCLLACLGGTARR